MTWKLVVVETDGTPLGELTAATSRKIIWPLNDVANVAFTIDGQHSQAQLPVELVTDLVVYDDGGTKRFRGRLGSSGDQVSPSGEPANMTAVDYRGFLGRRIGPLGASYTALDQAEIAWALISGAQAMDAGDLGITAGVGDPTGVLRTIAFTDGAFVADSINQLASLDVGFEWEIDADLKLNIYYPQRGVDSAAVLEYPGTVASFTRTYDTTRFANAGQFSGASTLSPVTVQGSELPASPTPDVGTPGRMEFVASDSTITDPTVLGLRADYELLTEDAPPVGYQMVLRDGWWTPEQLWLGDTARLVLRSGRINEVSTQRVTQIEVDLGDDGGKTVTITTGPIPRDEGRDLQATIDRLTRLELAS